MNSTGDLWRNCAVFRKLSPRSTSAVARKYRTKTPGGGASTPCCSRHICFSVVHSAPVSAWPFSSAGPPWHGGGAAWQLCDCCAMPRWEVPRKQCALHATNAVVQRTSTSPATIRVSRLSCVLRVTASEPASVRTRCQSNKGGVGANPADQCRQRARL